MKKIQKILLLFVSLCLCFSIGMFTACVDDSGSDTESPTESSESPSDSSSGGSSEEADNESPVFSFKGYDGQEIVLPAVAAGNPVVLPAVKVTDNKDGDITSKIRAYQPTGVGISYEDGEEGRVYTLTTLEANEFELVLRADDNAGNRGVATVTFTVTAATADEAVSEEEGKMSNLAESGKVYKENFAAGTNNELVGLGLDSEFMYYRSDAQAINGTSLVFKYEDNQQVVDFLTLRDYLTRPGTLDIEFDIKLLSGAGSPQWYFGLTPLNNNVLVNLSALSVGETKHVSGKIVVDNDTPQGLRMFTMTKATMEIAVDNFKMSYTDQAAPTYIPTAEELASETGAVWDWTTKAMAVANGDIVATPEDLKGTDGWSNNAMHIANGTNSGSDFYATNDLFVVGKTYEVKFAYKLNKNCGALVGVHAGTLFDVMPRCSGKAGDAGVYKAHFKAKDGDVRFILYGVFDAYIGDFSIRVMDPSELEEENYPFEAPSGAQWIKASEAPEAIRGQEGFSDYIIYGNPVNSKIDFKNFSVEEGKTYKVSFKYYLEESGFGNWNQVHFGNGTKANELLQTVGVIHSYEIEYTAVTGDTNFSLLGACKIYIGDITFEIVAKKPFAAPEGGKWVEAPEALKGQEGFSEFVLYGEYQNTGFDFNNFKVEVGKTYIISFKYYLIQSGWGNWNQIHFGNGTKVNELSQTVGTIHTYELTYTAVEKDTHFYLFGACKIYFGDIKFEEVEG